MATASKDQIKQAIDTLESVEDYREGLTNQAAGFIWAIWGFALLGIGLVSFIGVLASVHLGVNASWMDFPAILLFTAVGALMTRAANHMMAIDLGSAAWKPWAFGAGAIIVFGGIVATSNALAAEGSGSSALMMAPLLMAGAIVAGTLALLMRKSVRMTVGWIAGGILLAGFFNARFAEFNDSLEVAIYGNLAIVVVVFATFLVVGWLVFRRG